MKHPCEHFRLGTPTESAGHCDQGSVCGDRPSFACWRVCAKYSGPLRDQVKIELSITPAPTTTPDPATAEAIAKQMTPAKTCCDGSEAFV